MIYLAVSATNQCGYCIASHTAAARKAGMTDAMFAELMAVVGMANETNRLASGYQVEIDEKFLTQMMFERVLATVRRIPKGKVATYGDVAAASGYPGARAPGGVGAAFRRQGTCPGIAFSAREGGSCLRASTDSSSGCGCAPKASRLRATAWI